jgi:N-sulfoglucosamine sulfohydrolase
MNRRHFLYNVGAGLAASTFGCSVLPSGTQNSRRPNIVIVLSDDHSKRSCGCYGAPVVKTPNIDRLASQGMKFNAMFTPTAQCAPSRTTLMTGLYTHRHGVHGNGVKGYPDIKRLNDYLEPLGYRFKSGGKGQISANGFEDILVENAMNPFCLIVSTSEPHSPWRIDGPYDPSEVDIPPTLVDTPETRRDMANYFNDVAVADAWLGEYEGLLQKHGMAENTLLIYTSDHGWGFPFGKWTCYDEGLGVPFIARWPGKIEPGSETDALACFTDILPTFVEIAGGQPPEDIDGRSLLPVLTGKKEKHHERIFGAQTTEHIAKGSYYPSRSIRSATHKYIVNLNPDGEFRNLNTEGTDLHLMGRLFDDAHPEYTWDSAHAWRSWKEKAKTDAHAAERVRLYQRRPPAELYDLRSDPCEMNNLADDSGMKELKAGLHGELKAWMAQQGDFLLKLM